MSQLGPGASLVKGIDITPNRMVGRARLVLATAAGPAAGRYARHRATARWRGGGDRHEASWSDRGVRRVTGPARRRGDGLAVARREGAQIAVLPRRALHCGRI